MRCSALAPGAAQRTALTRPPPPLPPHRWDATSLGVFWTLWNLPVHRWAKRHLLIELQIYLHLKRRGAVLATFLLSALIHEIVLCTAFKTIKPWFFFAMALQVPLIFLSRAFHGTSGAGAVMGNAVVWFSLWVGQPCLELLYARSFLEAHPTRTGADLLCLKA